MDLLLFFKNYREDDFKNAIISTNEIVVEMDIEPMFRAKCIIDRKK